MRRYLSLLIIVPLVAVMLYAANLSLVADDQGDANEDQSTAAEKGDTEKDKAKPPKDRYEVPEGDAKTLMSFIESLEDFQPTSRREYIEYLTKGPDAIKTAAEKIMKLENNKESEIYKKAAGAHLGARVSTAYKANDDEKKQLVGEVRARVESALKAGEADIQLGMELAQMLEMTNNSDLAEQVYRDQVELMKEHAADKYAEVIESLEAKLRLLTLVGNPLKLEGKTLAGEDFDWESYRGKVVLVDFWATWCGPCRAEIPNIRANYEKYHEQGFEVVGISLDDNRLAVEKYVGEKKLPWTNLHQDDGERNKIATYYGINAIPEVILVGKDGNVIARHVRGEKLGQRLKELLGGAEEAPGKEAG